MKKHEKDLQEQKKKVEDFSKELKEFSDEELDQVAGGILTISCSMNCIYDKLHNKCDCL